MTSNGTITTLTNLPECMTYADVARVLQVTTKTVRAAVKDKRFPAPTIILGGRTFRWTREAVTEFLANCTNGTACGTNGNGD